MAEDFIDPVCGMEVPEGTPHRRTMHGREFRFCSEECAARFAGLDAEDRMPLEWIVGFCVLLAVAAFFLWTEHRAHVFAAVPWLLLLACPLIHVFMHRRHRHEGRP